MKNFGEPLNADDLATLAKSWITPECAESAGLVRVDSATGANLIGRNGNGDYSGIAIPYLWPGAAQPRAFRLRRDNPDLEQRSDGTTREIGKYLAEPGRGNLLYFPPFTSVEWLSDSVIPAVITEGEKKALALGHYFREQGQAVLVIGLSGVWNWRGIIGKTTDANGRRISAKGVINDIERIEWSERDVAIIFDANVKTSEDVNKARIGLTNALAGRGAAVWFVELPDDFDGNGVDDLLGQRGPEAFAEIWNAGYRAISEMAMRELRGFYAYLPDHRFIFIQTRELWPASSINSRIGRITTRVNQNGDEVSVSATRWLDRNRAVQQMTWAPGEPDIIKDKLIAESGWFNHPGARCFNSYRGPQIGLGDASKATPWLEHISRLYPGHEEHIIRWLAHRVQRAQEKINHALVLGGRQGIGKDSLFVPVQHAVGPWNVGDVSPHHLLGRFNGFVKSVILRISEARDLGDVDRYSFYEHTKIYTAAPPDALRVDEKNRREYYVPNLCGVILTTNHADGIYLPADDRRHYVAWSNLTKEDFDADYWSKLYRWYEAEGNRHVAAFLNQVDLSDFDAKAPPPQTDAWKQIVDLNQAPEDAELADVIDSIGNPGPNSDDGITRPDALTLEDLADAAQGDFRAWLLDRRNRRIIPQRLETAGYVAIRNDDVKDGQWVVSGKRQTVYVKRGLSISDRISKARKLVDQRRRS